MDRQTRDYRQPPPVDWRSADSDGELSDTDDEWWSDESSCSTCSSASYDDDRWSMASEAISGGELFYIECKAQNVLLAQKMKKKLHHSGISASAKSKSWKKGAHGTLVRLIKRGRKKVSSKNREDENDGESTSQQRSSSATSLEQNAGEIIEVRLLVEPRRHNLGRRATLIEILLGIVPGNFSMPSDDDRIMVAGFIPDMPASLSKKMKIGDWLQSIDGQHVQHSNIDNLLSKINSNSTVTLRLRRVEECSNIHAAPYLLSKGLEIDHLLQIMCKGAAAMSKGCLALLDTIEDKIIYSYPPEGPLLDSRGLFLTLAQFFTDTFDSRPISTRITFDNVPFLVMYKHDENHILLLAIPLDRTQEHVAVEFFNKFIESVQFSYHSFVRASSEYKTRLDLLVDSLFSQMQKNEQQLLFHTHFLTLPNKIQNEVDNALSQLEAAPSNIRSSGMYYIIGSCLFYKNVCVRSHLPEGVLSPVTSFLWVHLVLSLEQAGLPLQRLLAWKEIFLPEQSAQPDAYEEPIGRNYILLLGQNQFMIAVIIKTDSQMDGRENNDMMKPSVSYIEQVQETLDTLQLIGLSSVLDALLEDKTGEIAEKGSISDQQSISSDQNLFHRTNSVEGIKRFSPKRQSSRLSVNSEGETFSETSSEASWNSSELSSYGRLSRCKTPSRFALESFGRGLQSLLVASSSGSVVLVSATLRESLDTQLDNLRLKLMHLLSQEGHRGRVMGAVVEVGLVLAGRGKKSDDFCVLAGKKLANDGSGGLKVVFVCSEDIGINLTELASRLSIISF